MWCVQRYLQKLKRLCLEKGIASSILLKIVTLLLVARQSYLCGRFFGHFFWKVEGTVRIHVSHVQLLYTVINVHSNMQGGGD